MSTACIAGVVQSAHSGFCDKGNLAPADKTQQASATGVAEICAHCATGIEVASDGTDWTSDEHDDLFRGKHDESVDTAFAVRTANCSWRSTAASSSANW